jgi:hypothetical protein
MAYQIIKQPNGMYAIWSTNVDDFVAIGLIKFHVEGFFVEEARSQIRKQINDIFDKIEAGECPYHQFTLSYEDAIETIKKIHGKKANSLKMLGEV